MLPSNCLCCPGPGCGAARAAMVLRSLLCWQCLSSCHSCCNMPQSLLTALLVLFCCFCRQARGRVA
jgi:hypothetical protein